MVGLTGRTIRRLRADWGSGVFDEVALAVVAVAGYGGDVRLYAIDSVEEVETNEDSQLLTFGTFSNEFSVRVHGAQGDAMADQIVDEVRRRFEAARPEDGHDATASSPDGSASVSLGLGALAAGDCGFTAVGGSLECPSASSRDR